MTRAEDDYAESASRLTIRQAITDRLVSKAERGYQWSPWAAADEASYAVIAAIRDPSDDDLAALIRGHIDGPVLYDPPGYDGGTLGQVRVVGPWRPADGLNGAGAATGAAEAATDAQGPA